MGDCPLPAAVGVVKLAFANFIEHARKLFFDDSRFHVSTLSNCLVIVNCPVLAVNALRLEDFHSIDTIQFLVDAKCIRGSAFRLPDLAVKLLEAVR